MSARALSSIDTANTRCYSGGMVWFSLLLIAFNFFGFSLLLARLAGWSVSDELYHIPAILLFWIGLTVLVIQLIIHLIERFLRISLELRRRIHLQRSLDNSAALLAVSTSVLMIGVYHVDDGEVALVVVGAAGCVISSLLFARQFRRYRRWRSICIRRESRRLESGYSVNGGPGAHVDRDDENSPRIDDHSG